MPTPIYYPPTDNALQKQLNANFTLGGTILTLNNTTSIQNKPGVCVVNRIDTNGNALSSSVRTYYSFTGTSGATLVGVVAVDGTDQDHAIGEIVEFIPDVTWGQMVADGLATLLSDSDVTSVNTTNVVTPTGTQTLTNKTLTSPVLNTGVSGTAVLDEDDMSSNSATKLATQQSIKAYVDSLTAPGGWTSYSAVVPTRASDDDPTFELTFAGVDLTSTITAGMKIKWTQNSTVRYGIVTKMAFSTNTTMTVFGGTDYNVEDTATHTISAFNYSTAKSPVGFPTDPLKWKVELTDTSNRSQATPSASTWYNLGSLSLAIPIGSWNVYYRVLKNATDTSQTTIYLESTLSTANNSETDIELTDGSGLVVPSGTLEHVQMGSASKTITLASKTTYYLNAQTLTTGLADLKHRGDLVTTVIRATCAYL